MKLFWLILQLSFSLFLWFPVVLWLISAIRKQTKKVVTTSEHFDYAIIVTAYQQIDLIHDVIKSLLQLDYQNYTIYLVADDCDISTLNFNSDKVIILKPANPLRNNIKSHVYAIDHFIKAHDMITIIDSDNLVDPGYLRALNSFFDAGYRAVQGVRAARNLNTVYACLDEAGDMFYRYIDRKLLFSSGSSASLAGSGMAFTSTLYQNALSKMDISGAGFDKVLQYELVNKGFVLAFAEEAIVYDAKTTKSDQLVKQRARWINTWFKYWVLAVKLCYKSIQKLSWNRLGFSIMLLRPPLFMLFGLAGISILIDVFFCPQDLILWLISFICFFSLFFKSLSHFSADAKIYQSLWKAPKFIFFQVLALLKVKSANKISVATKHDISIP